ncbi:hypothetical protein SNEBB_006052 [Seison nebaliae]|nr:hypothetical protein SNEBB_006052 [Seison nebaliae]
MNSQQISSGRQTTIQQLSYAQFLQRQQQRNTQIDFDDNSTNSWKFTIFLNSILRTFHRKKKRPSSKYQTTHLRSSRERNELLLICSQHMAERQQVARDAGVYAYHDAHTRYPVYLHPKRTTSMTTTQSIYRPQHKQKCETSSQRISSVVTNEKQETESLKLIPRRDLDHDSIKNYYDTLLRRLEVRQLNEELQDNLNERQGNNSEAESRSIGEQTKSAGPFKGCLTFRKTEIRPIPTTYTLKTLPFDERRFELKKLKKLRKFSNRFLHEFHFNTKQSKKNDKRKCLLETVDEKKSTSFAVRQDIGRLSMSEPNLYFAIEQ